MKDGDGKKILIPFEKWNRSKVEKLFGLEWIVEKAPFLTEWLTVTETPPPTVLSFLDKLRADLVENAYSWNEIELFIRFITPLLQNVGFYASEKRIQEFADRSFVLPDERYKIKVRPDWFVARGRNEPEAPAYFFLHEYKRFTQGDCDPLGQLLISMLAAQKHNNDGLSIYGAFVMLNRWYFVSLNGNVFSESYTYDAQDPEKLAKIWLILNKTKQIIYDRVDKRIEAENEKKA